VGGSQSTLLAEEADLSVVGMAATGGLCWSILRAAVAVVQFERLLLASGSDVGR